MATSPATQSSAAGRSDRTGCRPVNSFGIQTSGRDWRPTTRVSYPADTSFFVRNGHGVEELRRPYLPLCVLDRAGIVGHHSLVAGTYDEDAPIELNEVLPAVDAIYGRPAAFAQGHPLRFPDFELMYRGKTASPQGNGQTWVFRLRDASGDREITIFSGGALSEPGAAWTIGTVRFTMDWVRSDGEPLRQIVVNAVHD
jgi:hypothetical protein